MFTDKKNTVYIIFKERENLVFSNTLTVQQSPEFIEIRVKSLEDEDTIITYWFPVSDVQEVKIVTKRIDSRG